MTDRDIICRVKNLTNNVGGSIIERPGKKPQHSTTYTFQVASQSDVKELLTTLLPYMGERRSAKIEYILSNM